MTGERELSEREGLQHRENLRDDQNAAAIGSLSTQTPAIGAKRKVGICPANATTPRSNGDRVSL